jgi:hypothetical protein
MKTFINTINAVIALLIVASIIVYAAIVIPIALGCFAGFCLALWIISHVIDAVHIVYRKLRKFVRREP